MPGAAELVEIVDIQPAQVNLERLENIGDSNVLLLCLDAIHIDIDLRHIRAERGEERPQLRALGGGVDHMLCRGLKLLGRREARVILDLQRKSTGIADAVNRRWKEHHRLPTLHGGVLLLKLGRNRIGR